MALRYRIRPSQRANYLNHFKTFLNDLLDGVTGEQREEMLHTLEVELRKRLYDLEEHREELI